MRKMLLTLTAMILATIFAGSVMAKTTYKVAWSHYTGWEPWAQTEQAGTLEKWGDKDGITIVLSPPMDYMGSINLYTAGNYDACVMTNMDALTVPASGGKDSTVVIVGDYSDGNDAIVSYSGTSVADLRGRDIFGVELSVSHYLVARALAMNGMSEADLGAFVNTSDSEIAGLFVANRTPQTTVVTWNPIVMKIRQERGAKVLFTSAQIPGEILDLLVVRTDAPEELKKALTGAWYETMAVMSGKGAPTKEALTFMAKTAGGTLAEFEAQLKTTYMYYTPKAAVEFTASATLAKTMEFVRTFCFDKGMFGPTAKSKDEVGIELPDGSVMGDKRNVKLRFTTKYMQMAADGKL